MRIGKTSSLTMGRKLRLHLRILPPFVMNPILHRTLLVFLIGVFRVEHLGFVQEFMVKAQDFLLLAESMLINRCHFGRKLKMKN